MSSGKSALSKAWVGWEKADAKRAEAFSRLNRAYFAHEKALVELSLAHSRLDRVRETLQHKEGL